MRAHLVAYAVALVVLLALDALWLGLIGTDWYRAGLGHLRAEQVNFVAAGLFYLLFPVGVVVFALMPARDTWHAAKRGGLLGFLCYATYDLTNLATLEGVAGGDHGGGYRVGDRGRRTVGSNWLCGEGQIAFLMK